MKRGDVVTILNAPLSETYGGQLSRNWEAAQLFPDVPADVQPIGSQEDTDRRDTAITRWRIILGPGEPLNAASRVRWAGAVREGDPLGELDVEGDVGLFKLRGRPHHQEAVLKRVVDA